MPCHEHASCGETQREPCATPGGGQGPRAGSWQPEAPLWRAGRGPGLAAKPLLCSPVPLAKLSGGSFPGRWRHRHGQRAVMGKEQGSLSPAQGLSVEASVTQLVPLGQGGCSWDPSV